MGGKNNTAALGIEQLTCILTCYDLCFSLCKFVSVKKKRFFFINCLPHDNPTYIIPLKEELNSMLRFRNIGSRGFSFLPFH